MTLDKVGDVHWHLVDLGIIELLNVFQTPPVVLGDEVDSHAFTTETTASPNSGDKVGERFSYGGTLGFDYIRVGKNEDCAVKDV